jgi:hypothetical protein
MIMSMDERFPPLQWGVSFKKGRPLMVENAGDCLRVAGFKPSLPMDLYSWDIFEAYRKIPKDWGAGRIGTRSPHIQFANADTDEKLVAFVERFGPVVASSVRKKVPAEDVPPILTADQNWEELRNERSLYRSALILLSELKHGKNANVSVLRRCMSDISDKVSYWPAQSSREQKLREFNKEPPITWEFGQEASRRVKLAAERRLSFGERIAGDSITPVVRSGHDIVCELLNAFRPWVYRWNDKPAEAPHRDLRYGIRPILYSILRREYFLPGGVAICANAQCLEAFTIDRAGQRFCTTECSLHQRQREYWANRGKKLRKRRLRSAKR